MLWPFISPVECWLSTLVHFQQWPAANSYTVAPQCSAAGMRAHTVIFHTWLEVHLHDDKPTAFLRVLILLKLANFTLLNTLLGMLKVLLYCFIFCTYTYFYLVLIWCVYYLSHAIPLPGCCYTSITQLGINKVNLLSSASRTPPVFTDAEWLQTRHKGDHFDESSLKWHLTDKQM